MALFSQALASPQDLEQVEGLAPVWVVAAGRHTLAVQPV